jgi:hypothetical protein
MHEDISFHEAESLVEEKYPEDGQTYRYEVISTSTDWETGLVDDIDCGFVKVQGET